MCKIVLLDHSLLKTFILLIRLLYFLKFGKFENPLIRKSDWPTNTCFKCVVTCHCLPKSIIFFYTNRCTADGQTEPKLCQCVDQTEPKPPMGTAHLSTIINKQPINTMLVFRRITVTCKQSSFYPHFIWGLIYRFWCLQDRFLCKTGNGIQIGYLRSLSSFLLIVYQQTFHFITFILRVSINFVGHAYTLMVIRKLMDIRCWFRA